MMVDIPVKFQARVVSDLIIETTKQTFYRDTLQKEAVKRKAEFVVVTAGTHYLHFEYFVPNSTENYNTKSIQQFPLSAVKSIDVTFASVEY